MGRDKKLKDLLKVAKKIKNNDQLKEQVRQLMQEGKGRPHITSTLGIGESVAKRLMKEIRGEDPSIPLPPQSSNVLTKDELMNRYEVINQAIAKGLNYKEIASLLGISYRSALYWITRFNSGNSEKMTGVDKFRALLDSGQFETYDLAKRYSKSVAATKAMIKKAELEYSPVDDWVKKVASKGVKLSYLKQVLEIKTKEKAKEILKENFPECIILETPIGDDIVLTPVYSSKEDVEWLSIDTSQKKFDYYFAPEGNYLCVMFDEQKIKEEEIQIVWLSDIHVSSNYFRREVFKKTIEDIKNKPNCFVILGGDLIECNNKNSNGSTWEQHDSINGQVEEFFELIKPIADRILLSVEGNHEERVERHSEFSLARLMANMLRVPFTNLRTTVDLNFKGQSTLISCVHYYGKGLFGQAAIVNKVKAISSSIASPIKVWLSGHTHSAFIQPEIRMQIVPGKGEDKFRYHICNSGSFTQHTGSYSEKAGFSPSPQDMIIITLNSSGLASVKALEENPL
jgi:predicted MPP superfamily phosphohydrolase/transposase-like protein